ncbi:DoxX family protein [Oceanobacillus sp. FSL K6-2867]|uniref:DoxX family protein n=1 Tax=Oceanobacillus sp. FSL K6-2867 TaxID=2954748 RepID=UPI0030D7A47F
MTKNEAGSVILRIVLGITFFIHGLDKFQAGIGNIAGYFESLGIPGFLAYIVAFIELIGGIALILGIGTKIVSVLIAIIMLGAIFTAKLSLGFLDGYELDIALLAISIYLILADRTPFSLDYQIAVSKK